MSGYVRGGRLAALLAVLLVLSPSTFGGNDLQPKLFAPDQSEQT